MNFGQRFLVVASLSGLAIGCGPNAASKNEWIYARVPKVMLGELSNLRYERDHKYDDRYAFVYMEREDFAKISDSEGVRLVDSSLALRAFDAKSLVATDSEPSEGLELGYHNYEILSAKMRELAARFPEISRLESAGKSVSGRELWYMRISDGIDQQDVSKDPAEREPKALYVANMHGDEVVGRELSLNFIEMLLTEYERDPSIKELVTNSDLFVLPSMNPDGFEARERHNSNGKDLNRNFPDFSSDPSDTLEGREPETQAVMNLHDRHHFILAANFHGGEVCVNLPWDTIANRPEDVKFGDDALLVEAGRAYTRANAPMYANHQGTFDHGLTYGYEWYEVDGGMQDWGIYYRRSIHATIELSAAKWPSASTLPRYWLENREAMLKYFERSRYGAHLVLTDEGGAVLASSIKVKVQTKGRTIVYDGPYIHRPLPAGSHAITVEAPGFKAKTLEIDASTFVGDFVNVPLIAEL